MELDPAPVLQPPPPKRRSQLGCNTCRARKVKCDERPNGCANCERLHLECSGYHQPRPRRQGFGIGGADQPPTPGRRGRRTYRSCIVCRTAKTKCSGERPCCARCRENQFRCLYDHDAATTARHRSSVGSASASISASAASEPAPEIQARQQASSNDGSETVYSIRQAPAVAPSSPSIGDVLSSPLPWLSSPKLPGPEYIRTLVDSYFQNFHPLRCFSFIHKPSFLRRLDDELSSGFQNSALLHIMCTLGAQYYALEYSDTVQQLPTRFILLAGYQWAKTAQRMLLEAMDKISVEGLMTAQLLHDHALRMANFALAFMLSALMSRMAQALQINLEYSVDLLGSSSQNQAGEDETENENDNGGDNGLSVTTRESRRRLMWSCYVTDALCGSGVDQLTLIDEQDIKIQLPCNDRHFLQGRACITRTLSGPPLGFLPEEVTSRADPDENMGMLAYFIRHIEIRRRVLRYIKHLDTARLPWLPDSEFAVLKRDLRAWQQSLPPSLQFTTPAVYIRRESSQLGALCLLHCAFHQTTCDLHRLGAPALYALRSPFRFPPEQAGFLRELRWTLFTGARAQAAIIAESLRHGPRAVGDTWLPTSTYDSSRIMLYYLTQVIDPPTGQSKRDVVLETIPYLQSNLRALKVMRALNAVADGLSRAAEMMLERLGVGADSVYPYPNLILDDPYLAALEDQANGSISSRRSHQGTPPPPPPPPSQRGPDYVLNPLSIFRLARNDIPERHAPETTTVSPRTSGATPGRGLGRKTGDSVPAGFRQRGGTTTAEMAGVASDGVNDDDFLAPDLLLSDLEMFFTSDLGWDWRPAETAVGSGMEGEGLLPWVGGAQQLGGGQQLGVTGGGVGTAGGVGSSGMLEPWLPPNFTLLTPRPEE